jgi:ribosomal protein L40E
MEHTHHLDILMENSTNLFKICTRCLFRVPLVRSMCKTCGNRDFVRNDEIANSTKQKAVTIDWPILINWRNHLLPTNAPADPAENPYT